MQNYSFWYVVVTVCALFTDGRADGLTDGRRTRLDDISTAEVKALSCAKNGLTVFSKVTLRHSFVRKVGGLW